MRGSPHMLLGRLL